jgi:hypothetical protein
MRPFTTGSDYVNQIGLETESFRRAGHDDDT